MPKFSLILDGGKLSLEQINFFVNDPRMRVKILPSSLGQVAGSHKFLLTEINKKVIYGVNTGFGPMASYILGSNQLEDLQLNLVRSHAVGIGQPVSSAFVIAAMLVRLNTLLKGFSGVSPALLERLAKFINHRIVPVVPEHGAVGASGDLVQLAHIALAFIGEGEVFYKDKRQAALGVLRKLKLGHYRLGPKEGLALINGTSMMSGIASVLYARAARLLSLAIRNGALALEVARAQSDSVSRRLFSLRPHKGQVMVAGLIRSILSTSKRLRNRSVFKELVNSTREVKAIPRTVQEIYSLRCISQILGPVADILQKTFADLSVEINSVTDNPIVDWKNRQFLHGGNFHGDQVATVIDQLKLGLVKLTMLSERRINFLLNSQINHFFPPFLNLQTPGLTLGLQGLQFVATSTAAQNQTLAFPHSLHSIPTNADNQDVVSMGTDAALMLEKVIENAFVVLSIELLALAQAMDFLGKKEWFSDESRKLYRMVRSIFPKIDKDRVIAGELEELTFWAKNSSDLDLKLW